MAKSQEKVSTVNTYSLEKASSMLDMANELQKFIKDNNLSTTIQGKQYPGYEVWQFLGANLGIIPITISCEDISINDEIKYKSVVELRRMDNNQMVGIGFATCSNKEYSKKRFDEYAICSMSQTRAVGKAFRNSFAWLMKASGYESCNSEEMHYENNTTENDTSMNKEEVELTKLKMQLMTLLFHKSITQAEKELVVEKINNFSVDRIKKAIAHYDNLIIERSVKPESDLEKKLKELHTKAIDLNMSDIVDAIDRRLESGSGEEKEIKELIANVEEEIKRRESEVQNA